MFPTLLFTSTNLFIYSLLKISGSAPYLLGTKLFSRDVIFLKGLLLRASCQCEGTDNDE